MPALDPAIAQAAMTNPATAAAVITPSDTADLEYFTRGIYVGFTGSIRVMMVNNKAPTTFANVQAGSLLPIECGRVYSTGTTATGLVAVW